MATYERGINGPIKGKVGSVIGSSWKGINYLKSLSSRKKNENPSAAQIGQREKFKIIGHFMKVLAEVISLGFNKNLPGNSGYNNAVAYVLKNALDTTTSPFSIRYNKVLVTRGEYPNDDNLTAGPGAPGKLLFQWENNTGVGAAKANDKVVMVAYSSLQNVMTFNSDTAIRSDGSATLDLDDFKGQLVETYISFLKADGTDVSSSIYTGQVLVAA
jgi:hypothetical protein